MLVELLKLYLPDDIDFKISYNVETRDFPSMTLSNPKLKMGLSTLLGKPAGSSVQIATKQIATKQIAPKRSFTGATT